MEVDLIHLTTILREGSHALLVMQEGADAGTFSTVCLLVGCILGTGYIHTCSRTYCIQQESVFY